MSWHFSGALPYADDIRFLSSIMSSLRTYVKFVWNMQLSFMSYLISTKVSSAAEKVYLVTFFCIWR